MGIHIAHWKIAGRTLAPLELNEVLHTLHLGIITAGFIFMTMVVLATSVVGRFFCSWGCHILALEDLSAWLLAKIRIHPKPIRSRVLPWIPPTAMAYLFLWPQVERLLRGASLPPLRAISGTAGWTSFVTSDLWRNLPGPWIATITFAVCGFAIVYFLGSRSFCRCVCPYGTIFAAAERLAPGRIIRTGDCSKCGLCTAMCQSHVQVQEEVVRFGTVVDSGCLKDLHCVEVCPDQALRFGFTRPPLFRSWAGLRRRKRRYSLSWRQDVLVAVTLIVALLVFRGLNGAVPFLLAIAAAAIYAYLVVLCLQLARDAYVRHNNFVLKISGRLTGIGRVFVIMALLLGALAIHSAFLRYHDFVGQRAYDEVARERAKASVGELSSTTMKAATGRALSHFETVYRWAWVRSSSLRFRLASLYLLEGSPEAAEAQLQAILEKEPEDREARLRLGELLLRRGRTEGAREQLQKVIAASEHLHSQRHYELRGAANAALAHIAMKRNKRSEAFRLYEQAVRDNPRDAEALLAIGVLLAGTNRLSEAEMYLLKSARLRPDSAVVHNNLGVVLSRLERDAEAIDHYRASLRIKPDNAQVHHNLGALLYKGGHLKEAAQSFQSALAMKPDYASAHYGLSLVLRDLSDTAQARRHRQRAAELDSRYHFQRKP